MGDKRVIGSVFEKFARVDVKGVNEENSTVDAIVSTESKDSDGDIIRQGFWDLKRFESHPVLIANHDYRGLLNQIGEWGDLKVVGKQLRGRATIYTGIGNAEADYAMQLALKGRLAFSVGFVPDMEKAEVIDSDGFWPSFEFKGQELLEVSAVTIPANAQALQRMKGITGLRPELVSLIEEELRDVDGEHMAEVAEVEQRVMAAIEQRFADLPDLIRAQVEPIVMAATNAMRTNEPMPEATVALEPIDIVAIAQATVAEYLTKTA